MIVWLWIGFILFVLVMLALDLGVFNRHAHVISTKEALRWTGLCVALAMVFTVFVYFAYRHQLFDIGAPRGGKPAITGSRAAMVFFTGYIIEMSLSMDNIFVIALIFGYFGIPPKYQHRVLFWGILGALVMRGVMIFAGVRLIERFEWMVYVFGVLLLLTAIKMALTGEKPIDYEKNLLVRAARRLYPVTPHLEGEKFFTRMPAPPGAVGDRPGRRAITPMFLALLIVESTDIIFAVDSIPAIIAITRESFIVFTSNVFAILCLRSMYFALSGMMSQFRYLKTSLVAVLAYVGIKMLLGHWLEEHHGLEIPPWLSPLVIVLAIAAGVVASIWKSKHEPQAHDLPVE